MGPLKGLRIIEMAAIGPVPYAAMLLSDMGADVIRIDRTAGHTGGGSVDDVLYRGRRSIAIDLKNPAGVDTALALIDSADAVIEGFRPGVMERLGLGPEICLERNPALVYGRMTGWGQSGPLARAAGHDINYIALTGALASIGTASSGPVPPLNLLGDFGGGATFLVMGVLAACLEAKQSGHGQVVDAAITDGVISLMSCIHALYAQNLWQVGRQSNMLDGGAHFYGTYECADGRWVAVGAIEPQFYALFAEKLGISFGHTGVEHQSDREHWPKLRQRVEAAFRTKSRDEWCRIMEGTDVCFAPVLDITEAPGHHHNVTRGSFVERDGIPQAAPAPRFSRTGSQIQRSPVAFGENSSEILHELGLDANAIAQLKQSGAVAGDQGSSD